MRKSKYYYVYRSALNGEFISKRKWQCADPATVYRERRLRYQ